MKNRLITLLLFIAALLWIYAKDRKTSAELLTEDADLIDAAAYLADPEVQRFMQENESWLNTEEGDTIRSRVTAKEIDFAINEALARTKEQ